MKITLKREKTVYDSVFGTLTITYKGVNIFHCKTLENRLHTFKTGSYNIINSYSTKFNTHHYELRGIKGRTGIRIHPANWHYELRGCIALGLFIDKEQDAIRYSKKAVHIFEELLKESHFLKITIK